MAEKQELLERRGLRKMGVKIHPFHLPWIRAWCTCKWKVQAEKYIVPLRAIIPVGEFFAVVTGLVSSLQASRYHGTNCFHYRSPSLVYQNSNVYVRLRPLSKSRSDIATSRSQIHNWPFSPLILTTLLCHDLSNWLLYPLIKELLLYL